LQKGVRVWGVLWLQRKGIRLYGVLAKRKRVWRAKGPPSGLEDAPEGGGIRGGSLGTEVRTPRKKRKGSKW